MAGHGLHSIAPSLLVPLSHRHPHAPSPPAGLDEGGVTPLIVGLRRSPWFSGGPLVSCVPTPGPLVRGLAADVAAAAGVGRGKVVVALPLGLQPQLVTVVLDV